MTWFRVDDKAAFHPKVVAAGNEAFGALCRAGAWCAERLTDGIFPVDVARLLARKRIWEHLISVGFLQKIIKDGVTTYAITDYLDWNPSREVILAERDRKAKNLRDLRERRNRGGNRLQAPEVTGPVTGGVTGKQPGRNHGPIPIPLQERRAGIDQGSEPVCVSGRENEKANGAHTHGPKLDQETTAIRDRIRQWPIFRELPAERLAVEQSAILIPKGLKLAWVLESIDVCAAKCADGTTIQAKQSMLVSFMRRKPRDTDAAAEPRRPVGVNHDDPVLRERARKALAEERRLLDERVARERAQKKPEPK